MAKYEVRGYRMEGSTKLFYIMDTDKVAFFSGYSFMGDAEWTDSNVTAKWMELEEAEAIRKDLEASDDEPEQDPATKQYLFKVWVEDELCISIETGKKIAEYYETDQYAGIYSKMEVWDVSGEPKRISLLDLVEPILENKRWMEQEYRDYCENEWY